MQGVRQGSGVLHHGRQHRHPVCRQAEDRKQTKAIQCGFDADGKGGIVLGDAENKGEEIKAEVG
jgi:hypothetical protein